jgi:hypothetical protein
MPTIPRATHLIKSFEALMLFNVTSECLITYLLYEGMKNQKSDYSQIPIEAPCEDLPFPLAHAGDKRVKRFHF